MFHEAWRGAIESAAALLPPGDSEALVFYEEREDLRASLADGAIAEWNPTFRRGGSVRSRASLVHASNPEPGDFERLVSGRTLAASPAGAASGRDAWHSIDGRSVRSMLDDISDRVGRTTHAGVSIASCVAEWIGFRQSVLVQRPAAPLREDERRSSRLRVRVAVERGGATAVASIDRVVDANNRLASPGQLADSVVGRAVERLDALPAPMGGQCVVFAPGVAGILFHEWVGHALEGDVVSRGGSMLARLAPPVASPILRVIDDPSRGRAAWRFDDEGQPARAVTLLAEGAVTGYLHDTRSAARLGTKSTGHGRRSSYGEPVRPRMGCTYVDAGTHSADEILATTAQGIHVRRMESAGMDPSSGRSFFRVTDADRIVSGRLAEPLLPFLMLAEGPDVLHRIDRVGNDLAFDTCLGACVRDGQPLATSVGTPTCRLGMITAFV